MSQSNPKLSFGRGPRSKQDTMYAYLTHRYTCMRVTGPSNKTQTALSVLVGVCSWCVAASCRRCSRPRPHMRLGLMIKARKKRKPAPFRFVTGHIFDTFCKSFRMDLSNQVSHHSFARPQGRPAPQALLEGKVLYHVLRPDLVRTAAWPVPTLTCVVSGCLVVGRSGLTG